MARVLLGVTPVLSIAAFVAGVQFALPQAPKPAVEETKAKPAETSQQAVNVPIFSDGQRVGYCAFELDVRVSKDMADGQAKITDQVFAQLANEPDAVWSNARCETLTAALDDTVSVKEAVFVEVVE